MNHDTTESLYAGNNYTGIPDPDEQPPKPPESPINYKSTTLFKLFIWNGLMVSCYALILIAVLQQKWLLLLPAIACGMLQDFLDDLFSDN